MPKDTPKMFFLDFAATKNSPLMCRFLGGVNHEHNEFFDSVWESLILQLNAKMLLANQIAGFLNLNISKTIGGLKVKNRQSQIFWKKTRFGDNN